ncbi:MAG: SDR family NAD(P)-dependent oxidoreductase, partial [Desulfobacteraceae bacterium]
GYNGFRSWEAPLRVWDWVLKVNLMSVIHGIHYFMPIMLKQDTQAHIINTASSAGVITNAYGIPYAVSKHGVMALTESLFLELQSYTTKIKVSVLCPGIVKTDILNSSERSRPADVPIPQRISQEESVFIEAQKRYIEQSQDPQEIGDLVLEAIKEERLYIMTTRDFDKDIEQRMKNLLERKNPIAQKPSRKFIDILHDLSRENG